MCLSWSYESFFVVACRGTIAVTPGSTGASQGII